MRQENENSINHLLTCKTLIRVKSGTTSIWLVRARSCGHKTFLCNENGHFVQPAELEYLILCIDCILLKRDVKVMLFAGYIIVIQYVA